MLEKKIKEIFETHKKRYGVPRVHRELLRMGLICNKKRVERIMKKLGLRAQGKKPFKATTNSRHSHLVAPNIVDQYFEVSEVNQIWTGDITYIRTLEGWLYLGVVVDLFSRKIVGWSMGKYIGTELVVNAFNMAIKNRRPPQGLIFHSDRGVQYASHLFQRVVAQNGFIQSMSRKGNCWDNAPTESFFATLKKELIRLELYPTRQKAKTEIFQYIEGYYNNLRLHSFLDYNSPREFEEEFLRNAA